MMISEQLFRPQSHNKILLRAIAIIALIGFTDAAYLTTNHYFDSEIQCILTEGCEKVLTSSYSKIFNIPLAVFGVIFYIGVFILVNLADIYGGKFWFRILAGAGITGFLVSLSFLYIQAFMIGAFCFFCLISLGSSTLIFVLALLLNRNSVFYTGVRLNN